MLPVNINETRTNWNLFYLDGYSYIVINAKTMPDLSLINKHIPLMFISSHSLTKPNDIVWSM